MEGYPPRNTPAMVADLIIGGAGLGATAFGTVSAKWPFFVFGLAAVLMSIVLALYLERNTIRAASQTSPRRHHR